MIQTQRVPTFFIVAGRKEILPKTRIVFSKVITVGIDRIKVTKVKGDRMHACWRGTTTYKNGKEWQGEIGAVWIEPVWAKPEKGLERLQKII